jgi:hypothetical protein
MNFDYKDFSHQLGRNPVFKCDPGIRRCVFKRKRLSVSVDDFSRLPSIITASVLIVLRA